MKVSEYIDEVKSIEKFGRLSDGAGDSQQKFCPEFCAVMCVTFGIASFLMFSAWGRFSGVAWGNVDQYSGIDEGFIAIDVSDLQREDIFPQRMSELGAPPENINIRLSSENDRHADADNAASDVHVSSVVEDFGPLPKYLSDYESIVLSAQDDGTKLPDEGLYAGDIELPDTDVQISEVGAMWREHVVKSGETLSDIALMYGGLTAQDILRANGLKDANRLAENQLLLIPSGTDAIEDTLDEVRTRQARIAAVREKVEPLKIMAYAVMQGDSLWSIANSQNIEIDTLVGCNTFKSSAVLRPGDVLRIPNQDGIFYTIRKGEKLEDVCKRYGVNMKKMKDVNQALNIAQLKPGDEVFLPEARPEAEIQDAAKKTDKNVQSLSRRKTAEADNKKASVNKKALRSYRWPVMGRINSPFGWRRHPITKRNDFHTGIDIKASRGTLIRAAREGRVVYSGWMGGYGKVAVVEHSGGQSTLYAHCSSLLVKQGSGVSQGQDIARVGTTGRTTGPHLHFEVRSGNSPVNPLEYLK